MAVRGRAHVVPPVLCEHVVVSGIDVVAFQIIRERVLVVVTNRLVTYERVGDRLSGTVGEDDRGVHLVRHAVEAVEQRVDRWVVGQRNRAQIDGPGTVAEVGTRFHVVAVPFAEGDARLCVPVAGSGGNLGTVETVGVRSAWSAVRVRPACRVGA